MQHPVLFIAYSVAFLVGPAQRGAWSIPCTARADSGLSRLAPPPRREPHDAEGQEEGGGGLGNQLEGQR
jgi:hypothetical protein